MDALVFLIPISLVMGVMGLVAFFWAVQSGQFDDLQSPAERILNEEK